MATREISVQSLVDSFRMSIFDADRLYVLLKSRQGDKVRKLQQANREIGGHGVEYIPKGRGRNSPAIDYVNMGDPYRTTILLVRGKFLIGNWGNLVEKGNYV